MGDRMGSSPIDRTNRKDDSIIVFFSFSAKNDAALPLISKNSFQTRPNPNRHRLSRLNYCIFYKKCPLISNGQKNTKEFTQNLFTLLLR